MFKVKQNQEVTLVFKKCKNANDLNEVLITSNNASSYELNVIRCLITYIQTINNGSNYFTVEINNNFFIINFLHKRLFKTKCVYNKNLVYCDDVLLIRDNENIEYFKIITDRILKLNKLCL